MKPHLRKWRGIWHCYVQGFKVVPVGLGYTPKDAWIDWAILTNNNRLQRRFPSAATT